MKDINLGKLFGFEMVLKDVPEERAAHVKKSANYHMTKMLEAYSEATFGAIKRDKEVVKAIINPREH